MQPKATLSALLLIQVCLALDSRIINGEDAEPNAYPYTVSIHWTVPVIFNDRLICGGAILTANWILTSAQCVRKIGTVTVKAGKHKLSSLEYGQQVRPVTLQIIHDGYKAPNLLRPIPQNDIALFKLSEPLTLSHKVRPINLPANRNVSGIATVTGWGGTGKTDSSKVLQVAVVPVFQYRECQDIIHTASSLQLAKVSSNQICSGPIGGDLSACGNDVGSPLVQFFHTDKARELVGVVSWSDPRCGRRGLPTVYSKVPDYVKWIKGIANIQE